MTFGLPDIDKSAPRAAYKNLDILDKAPESVKKIFRWNFTVFFLNFFLVLNLEQGEIFQVNGRLLLLKKLTSTLWMRAALK